MPSRKPASPPLILVGSACYLPEPALPALSLSHMADRPLFPSDGPCIPEHHALCSGRSQKTDHPVPSLLACRPWSPRTSGSEIGIIHCGFGFSCHSPTQPTGRTMTIMWVPELLSRSIQDDSAPFDMLSNLKSLSSQRSWRLTPFSSVQTCQYGTLGSCPQTSCSNTQ
jgi:hypothetical protein